MSITIDIHALQTIPPSLINRDDTGSPKSAIFGGVPRQRVSSQSWKRAIRRDFAEHLQPGSVGFRTFHAAELIAKKVLEISPEFGEAEAIEAVKALFASAKISANAKDKKANEEEPAPEDFIVANSPQTGYLLFISPRQVENAAQFLVDNQGKKATKREALALLNQDHSIDIGMFGRMVADDAAYNVDAAVQVAHALGIHESAPEFDYFTAIDDVQDAREETGAGMIGTVQMMSSTLYRFATIDLESLTENLGNKDAAAEASKAFVNSFITSMPTGKQNTFANNTLPELIYVTVRDSRSVSLVNAFEEPVTAQSAKGRRQAGAERLANEEREIEENYGFVPLKAFVAGIGELKEPFADLAETVTVPELVEKLGEALKGIE